MGSQETKASPTAREISRITASSQRRPSRSANRSDGTARECVERLASTSEAERWVLVIAMKTCSSISPEKRQGNCEVTVYVSARDRRNCFDPWNYLLIKSKLGANYPTYAVTQRGWGISRLQNCKARRARSKFRARRASLMSERPSFLQSRRHPSAGSPAQRLPRE